MLGQRVSNELGSVSEGTDGPVGGAINVGDRDGGGAGGLPEQMLYSRIAGGRAVLKCTPPGNGHKQRLAAGIRGAEQTRVASFSEVEKGVLISNKAGLLSKGKIPW